MKVDRICRFSVTDKGEHNLSINNKKQELESDVFNQIFFCCCFWDKIINKVSKIREK